MRSCPFVGFGGVGLGGRGGKGGGEGGEGKKGGGEGGRGLHPTCLFHDELVKELNVGLMLSGF